MTPRGYLSWSQLKLWEQSPDRYTQLYIYDQGKFQNKGMEFGKMMAESLEYAKESEDAVLDMVMESLPKFEVMDKEFRVEMKRDRGQEPITLLIKPDSYKEDGSAFLEYKTGQKPWSKRKVDEDGQITFYTLGFYLKHGKIPGTMELCHVETIKDPLEGKIRATGQIYRHPTARTMADLINMMVRVKKAWVGIEAMCAKELI